MQKIVGVRRNEDKNIYYFVQDTEFEVGDKIVADFDDFQTVATVCRLGVKVDESKAVELKKIIRKATDADIKKYDQLKEKAKAALPKIKTKSLELGLMMKFVGAEYSLDSSKIMIVFSSEERVDFRQFLKDLATMLKTRIELKQIGQRDEVKVKGGVGPCGQPCCCARFLDDFEHVTVKMAKVQGLSLAPTKINGICGRLLCCLGYEAETYEEALAKMPKVGSEIVGPNGKGIVVYNDLLRERVSIKRQSEGDTFVVEDFSLDEIAGKKKKEDESEKTADEKQKHKNLPQENAEKPKFENKNNVGSNNNSDKTKENGQKSEDKVKVSQENKKPFKNHKKFKNRGNKKPE